MWINLAFIIVFLVVLIGFSGYSLAQTKNNTDTLYSNRTTHVKHLQNLLKNKKGTDYATESTKGVACYYSGYTYKRIDYICPRCGEKTIHREYIGNVTMDTIISCRKLVKKITKINVKLDETLFCNRCNINPDERPMLCITVKHNTNSKPQRHCDINEEDLNLIYEYSEGMKEHTTKTGKKPLVNYRYRLAELLGISKDNIK